MADSNSPLYIRPDLTAIAIKYRGQGYIADQAMPRVPVSKQEFTHLSDRMADWITPPDTLVGRTGQPNQLANAAQDPTQYATSNQGLDEPVPNQDQDNGPNETAEGRATQRVMELVMMRREIRVSSICANPANFTQSTTLSGASQWSDYAGSDPQAAIMDALDVPFKRPNLGVMGRAVATKLIQHPKIVQAVRGTDQGAGKVTLAELAALLELDQILVGSGWYNSAAKGQAPVKTRIWGKFAAFAYVNAMLGGPDGGTTWGYTAQFGERIAATYPDPKVGLFGGVWVRAGESVKEVVAAPEFGVQFLAAVA
jgi:hypothetical protein